MPLLFLVAPVLLAQPTVDFGRYHALVIGIDDYAHLPKLQSAVADARAVARILEDKYQFRVRLLIDPERDRIITEINALRRALSAQDNLLVYYAGHGVLDGDTGFWMAADALPDIETNWIPVSTLSRNFKQMTARHVLVVSDSCYSGTLVREILGGLRSGHEQREWVKRMNEKRSRTALTSGGLEPVLDSGGGGHSVFAKALLDVLDENEGVLDGQALFDRVKDPVVVNASQTPAYADIRNAGHEFGDFLFVPQGVTVALAPGPAAAPNLGLREGTPLQIDRDFLFWESIKDSDDPEDYRAYLKAFPDGTFASLATRRLEGFRHLASTSKGCHAGLPPLSICRDRLRDGSRGPEMVVLRGDSFQMGSAETRGSPEYSERLHTVRVDRFAMGKYEATFGEYDRFVDATGRARPDDQGWARDRRPVVNVSWRDATAYAQWLSHETGKRYRLPTEAEWEYAARAGTTTQYWWGKDEGTNHANCNGCGIPWDTQLAPVGALPANPFGLHDTAGNVWEWTCSGYDAGYGGAETRCDVKARYRVLRGGSFRNTSMAVRSAARDKNFPDIRHDSIGFRLAQDLQ